MKSLPFDKAELYTEFFYSIQQNADMREKVDNKSTGDQHNELAQRLRLENKHRE